MCNLSIASDYSSSSNFLANQGRDNWTHLQCSTLDRYLYLLVPRRLDLLEVALLSSGSLEQPKNLFENLT